MKAYISLSFNKRTHLREEIAAITQPLTAFQIASCVFVDNYNFNSSEERQMMNQAMIDIDKCDILIAETSEKGIGIGIEVGYARAKNKPIVYLRNACVKHSTTVSGISSYQIVYNNINDLQEQLAIVLAQLVPIQRPQ